MKAILGYQEVAEIVEEGYPTITKGSTEAQKALYIENKKKNCKATVLIHQCVDDAHFEKIAGAATSRETWKIWEKCNEGAEQLKKEKLQTTRRQCELMQMENNEKIADFFNRIITHTNVMKNCDEKISNQTIVEKIPRTLNPKFNHIVVAIEESKKLEEITVEELQGSLESHEERLIERETTKPGDHQTLQAHTSKRVGNNSKECVATPSSIDHMGNQSHNDYQAHMAKEENEVDSEEQPLMLMMITDSESHNNETRYRDSGYTNHMIGHRDWLVNFDAMKKSKVRFADNRVIQAEGAGNVAIRRLDGRQAMITDVLYVPGMKSNLISMGQPLEKGFSMKMSNGSLEVYDTTKKMIMKAPLARNRTFKVNLNTIEPQCFSAVTLSDDSWLWHLRLGHLNFKDLSLLR
ncbi:uncharacterized protein LOC114371738 [Glycine soja]|uniref:uncharacterized protein LOC114371738 n=1 Tax=Glycine soja TaxID=3848 RepID=UPI00103BD73B|nr:uncharacterized protein LOC114371738 [Glycine soja]